MTVTMSPEIESQSKKLYFTIVHEIETKINRTLKFQMMITRGVESTLPQGDIYPLALLFKGKLAHNFNDDSFL